MNDTGRPAHVSTGLLRVLESPAVYSVFQTIIGADRLRRHFVEEFVRPFPGAAILDIGCGTGSILDYLPRDVRYVGLDLNRRYISHAKKKYQGRGRFFCARVDGLASLPEARQDFDIVIAMAIIHHLDDRDAAQLIRDACDRLGPGGVFASFDGCYHPGQSLATRFLLSRDRGKNIRTPAGYEELLAGCLSPICTKVETRLYRVPYSLFFLRATKPGAKTGSSPVASLEPPGSAI